MKLRSAAPGFAEGSGRGAARLGLADAVLDIGAMQVPRFHVADRLTVVGSVGSEDGLQSLQPTISPFVGIQLRGPPPT